MNTQTKKLKLFLLGMACWMKPEVRNDGRYAMLFNLACNNAGCGCDSPNLGRYEYRASRDQPITQAYVKCLMASLEFYRDEVMPAVVHSCVESCNGLLHEGRMKQIYACTHTDMPKKHFHPDIRGVAFKMYDELSMKDLPYLRDALEEYGHQDEVTHILHNERHHTLACPVFLNVLGRYHN